MVVIALQLHNSGSITAGYLYGLLYSSSSSVAVPLLHDAAVDPLLWCGQVEGVRYIVSDCRSGCIKCCLTVYAVVLHVMLSIHTESSRKLPISIVCMLYGTLL